MYHGTTLFVLEPLHQPSKLVKLSKQSRTDIVVSSGEHRVFFGNRCLYTQAEAMAMFLEQFADTEAMAFTVSLGNEPRSEADNRIYVVQQPVLDFEVTMTAMLQNLSLRADVGIGLDISTNQIVMKHGFHSIKRRALEGGQKLAFDGPIHRKINLD